MQVEILLSAEDIVGESIVWHPAQQALYWVDICRSRIARLHPESGEHTTWDTPELPTTIGMCRDGRFIVGLHKRVALWTPDGPFETLAVPEPDQHDNRLNEGVVAPDGSFWVGTMQDNIDANGQPKNAPDRSGRLYRITSDGAVSRLTDDLFGITNTMIWQDDGSFITADTIDNALYRYEYDSTTHTLYNRTSFAQSPDQGLPDGSTRDAKGRIYNARVTGGAIARFAPDGTALEQIKLPMRQPTSCTFGRPDLTTLFVTSARFGMDPAELERAPFEGALARIDLGVKGQLHNLFG